MIVLKQGNRNPQNNFIASFSFTSTSKYNSMFKSFTSAGRDFDSTIDCEQSLSFPRVARAAICEGRARAAKPREARVRRKRKKVFFPASPHSLLVSFPNLHNINSSARRGFQEQKPTTRSLTQRSNFWKRVKSFAVFFACYEEYCEWFDSLST